MRHPGLCAHTSAEDESDAGAVGAHLCPPAGHQSERRQSPARRARRGTNTQGLSVWFTRDGGFYRSLPPPVAPFTKIHPVRFNMKRALLSLVLVAAVFSSFACERRGTGGTNGGGDTGAIKVGIYGDLSGQTSSFGQSTKNGALMAIDEINARAASTVARSSTSSRTTRASPRRPRPSSPSSSTRTRCTPSSARSLRPTASPPRPSRRRRRCR